MNFQLLKKDSGTLSVENPESAIDSENILSFENNIGLLWVSGLGLILVFFVDKTFRLTGEDWDWTEYLVMGTIFPGLSLGFSLIERFTRDFAYLFWFIRLLLGASSLLIICYLIFNSSRNYSSLI